MAPEINENKIYNGKKADVFSLGVILFVIVQGKFPFIEASQVDKFYSLIYTKRYMEYWQVIDRHNYLSQEFKDLM